MKKTLAVIGMVAVAAGAFAQGKVGFSNDSDRLVTWQSDVTKLRVAQVPSANTAVVNDGTLKATLYYNTAAGSASPVAESSLIAFGTIFTLNTGSPGFLNAAPITLPAGFSGTCSFQIRVWEASFNDYTAALTGGGYTGKSIVFTAATGSFTPNQLNASGSPSFSTWSAGPIYVGLVPEPSSLALAGLGAAALLVFRRRK